MVQKTALIICAIRIIIPIFLLFIIHIPMNDIINAGDAFEVQYNNEIACFLFIIPLSYKLLTADVPPGNPDSRLHKKA